MINDSKLALFLMLGQTAEKEVFSVPEIAYHEPLMISETYDLRAVLPELVKEANSNSESYRLFFVFENFLRDFCIQVLSKDGQETWWDKIPTDVQKEVQEIEEKEETKTWMALGSRDKSALMTYPQILRVIEHNWKDSFDDLVRDKALLQEARLIGHLRNTICHMSSVSNEELGRIKQVMRDWFRMVSP
jgi:hypothetical protein